MKTKAISSFFVLFAIASVIATTTPDAFADHAEVTIATADDSGFNMECAENCYTPSTATADVGGKVIFSNPIGFHTFTAGTWDSGMPTGTPSGEFDSGMLGEGESAEWIADVTPGEIPYYCTLHSWMKGMVIVQEVEAAHDEATEDAHDEATEDAHDEATEDAHDEDNMLETHFPEGDATTTGMLSDGTKVSIWASTVTANEMMEIFIEFEGKEHVNHDIMVTQQGGEYMNDEGAHHHDGKGAHVTAPLSSSNPVDITITFQGYGNVPLEERTGPIGEEVVFSNVVPEFGTIAMMILAVAIISIVAVTAKSRVVPRF